MIEIKLPIDPIPTPRPQVTRTRTGQRQTYYPGNYSKYKKDLTWILKGKRIQKNDYVFIVVDFHIQYPKSTPKKCLIEGLPHRVKPDADNLLKGILDGLESAGITSNDSKFAGSMTRKVYTTKQSYVVIKLFTYAEYVEFFSNIEFIKLTKSQNYERTKMEAEKGQSI